MKFANSINGLVVKFVKLDLLTDDTEVLVMERLCPIDLRAFEFERRQLIFEVFEDEQTTFIRMVLYTVISADHPIFHDFLSTIYF